MRIELRLLGRFTAVLSGDTPTALTIAAPRLRAVLAYLAMQPDYSETRERLAALLWGDSGDKQARQSLRQCLVALRRELGPHVDALVIQRDTVALAPDRIYADARELLDRATRPGEGDAYRTLELYRGEFLDGLDIDVEPFAQWVRTQRARVAAAATQVFEAGIAAADQAARGTEAITLAERLAALDPADERKQCKVVELLARYRGRDAALARAEALLVQIRDRLDAAPSPETAALIAAIRAMPASSAMASPALPASPAERTAPPATPEPVPDEPASAPPPRRRWRYRWMAAAAALIVGLVIAAIVYDRAATTGTTRGPDLAWRSPLVPGAGPDQQKLASFGAHAVIVLPFDGAGDPAAQRLADRVTLDVTNALSRVPAMRVIARATARLYRDRPVDVAAIGAELGVHYVVEGSARVTGERLRIDVSLVDAKSRLQLWTRTFELPKADTAALEDEIARGIARHLHLEILGDADKRTPPGAVGDGELRSLLARGWNAMLTIAAGGTASGADRYFEAVLRRDPDNVSALIGLGGYHVSVVAMFLVSDPAKHLARAEPPLAKALAKAPQASMAHYFQGVLHKTRGEPEAALKAFARTLEINPSFALAHAQVGHVLSRTGRLPEALEHIRYAIRLSPRDPNLGLWSLFGGQIELERGNDAAALDWLRRAAALNPQSPFTHATLAAALALQGDRPGAAQHAAKARALAPWITRHKLEERLVGLSTRDGAPRRLMEGLKKAFDSPS